jgi:hypothetical protein
MIPWTRVRIWGMATPDLSEIIKGLQDQAENTNKQREAYVVEAARLGSMIEKLERAIAILLEGAARSTDDHVSGRSGEAFAAPIQPRPTKDAVRDVLRRHAGAVLTVQELLREIQLRGWIDAKITAPIEAVRYAAKVLAEADPNVERVGVSHFRWASNHQNPDELPEEAEEVIAQ